MKCDETKNAHHIIVFLNENKEGDGPSENGEDGESEPTEVFPDINACENLRTLTYVLWNIPDGNSGEHEYDDFRSLIKAHHVLGKSHSICTYGLYVEESLLVEEKVAIYDLNSGQVIIGFLSRVFICFVLNNVNDWCSLYFRNSKQMCSICLRMSCLTETRS